jgi:hypothetical protein
MKSRDLKEASPDTLPGSFTDDLILSKKWLCNYLKLIQNKFNHNTDIITILGSWYGNLGLFLDAHDIQFKQLLLVDIDKKNLDVSKTVLGNINHYKVLPILRDANEHSYQKNKNHIIINTSCNDMKNNGWFNNIPAGSLVALQGRNNVQLVPVVTNDIFEFDDAFPLTKTLILKQKPLQDPNSNYTRFMKIGFK